MRGSAQTLRSYQSRDRKGAVVRRARKIAEVEA
jgi:hypothetical protein